MSGHTTLWAQQYTEQAQVTNWPLRLVLVAVVLGIIALALWGMRRGWRGRQRRQADIPPPAPLPAAVGGAVDEGVSGLYLGTATAGDWLDRIAVHGLGTRSRASVAWSVDGIAIDRHGAPSFLIPAGDVVGIRVDRGVAGTVRAQDSVVVVTWRLGTRTVDTGFRADDGVGHGTLLDGLMAAFPPGDRA